MYFTLGERCYSGKVLNWEWVQRAGWWGASRPCTAPGAPAKSGRHGCHCHHNGVVFVPDCLPLFCPKVIWAGSWFKLLLADLNKGFGCQYPSNRVGRGSSPTTPQQSRWLMLHHASPVLSSTAAGISAELLWVSGNHMLKCYPACLWGVSYQLVNVNSVQTITTESLLV